MSLPINKSSFSLTPLNENGYQLSISFSNEEKNTLVSKEIVTFYQNSPVKEGVIWDVYTKNATCQKPFLKKTFCAKDLTQVEGVSKLIPNLAQNPVVAVFDLKHSKTGYLESDGSDIIGESEDEICQFFKSSPPTRFPHAIAIHSIFTKSMPLDFVICEGSLKKCVLKHGGFSEKEIEYFNSKQGAIDFCQSAEFFMNAFKLGQIAKINSTEFSAKQFIKPISTKFACFEPQANSTTIYPPEYKDIYALEGNYAKLISQLFSVTGFQDKNSQFTSMNISRKQ